MLTLATADLAGYTGEGDIKLAASVDSCIPRRSFMTTSSTTANAPRQAGRAMLWGNEASVLVGDFLLGQAFRMMVEVGNIRALDILSAAAATIAEGEVMQLAAAEKIVYDRGQS